MSEEQQSLKKIAAAFLAGVVIAGAAAGLLVSAFASEEPPIRVRPGSIELHLTGGKKWQARTGYWQIKDGEKTATKYDLEISTRVPTSNCTLAYSTGAIKIIDSEGDYFVLTVVDNNGNRRTRVTASNDGKVTLSADKRVLTISSGAYIKTFWDEVKGASICELAANDFVGAGVY